MATRDQWRLGLAPSSEDKISGSQPLVNSITGNQELDMCVFVAATESTTC